LLLLTELVKPYEGRIGENEKDGLVMNNYVRTPNSAFSQMGWHTDAPRDLFLGQKIMPMLNVGIHLDDCPFENGGLRVIPGTHKQGMINYCLVKNILLITMRINAKPALICLPATFQYMMAAVAQGAAIAPFGEKSRRRVMYIPIITGKYAPKNEKSKTPFYHKFASKVNR